MITDGNITYRYRSGNFLTWRFSNDVFNEIVIAALLTILSYQLAETVINLCFGIKRRGEAKLRDLQIILLIRKFSPIVVLRSIIWCRFRFPCFRRRPQREEEEQDEEELGETQQVESTCFPLSYLKLIFLLLAIPLINVGTVVLSLERDTVLTFGDSDFGGLAFGLDRGRSIRTWSPLSRTPSGECNSTELSTNAAEFPVAEFYSCIVDLRNSGAAAPVRSDVIRVQVSRSRAERIGILVQIAGGTAEFVKRTIILSRQDGVEEEEPIATAEPIEEEPIVTPEAEFLGDEDQSDEKGGRRIYYVQNNLSQEDADYILTEGMRLASTFCDSTENPQEASQESPSPNKNEEGRFDKVRFATCVRESEGNENEDRKSARDVALALLDSLSFVNSDELQVRDGDAVDREEVIAEEFTSGKDLVLLRRRRGFVSIPLMVVLAAGSVMLRALTELFTKNDLERGIGLIVRDGLGLPCCDSMLCSPDVVARYNRRGNILFEIERQPNRFNGRRTTDDAL